MTWPFTLDQPKYVEERLQGVCHPYMTDQSGSGLKMCETMRPKRKPVRYKQHHALSLWGLSHRVEAMNWRCRFGLHGRSKITVVHEHGVAIYDYRCRRCGVLLDCDVYDPREPGVWAAFFGGRP